MGTEAAVPQKNNSPPTERQKIRGALGNQFEFLKASLLCRRELSIASTKDVIGWWGARRIPFNLVVGTAGIVSCIIAGLVVLGSYFLGIGDFDLPDPPLFVVFGIVLYATAANVCFTGGWVAELAVRKFWPHEAERFATISFSLGLIFSVLLTLTPGLLLGIAAIFAIVGRLFGIPSKPL